MSAVMSDQSRQNQLSDDDLVSAIDDAETRTYGSEISSRTAQLAAERALAIDLYLGQDVEPAPDGQSSVIDRTVFETVQWILPSLCRIFANGEDVVTLVPINEADIEPAKQEAAYLNWLVTTKHPWFELFLEFATDALLTKNAYFLVYRDTKRTVEVEKYYGQTRMGVAYLTQGPNCQIVDQRSYPARDLPPEPVLDPQGQPQVDQFGQPVMGPAMLYDVVLRRGSDQKELCIRVIPPERVKVDQRTASWRIDETCNYFEYFEQVTLSDLRAMGFDAPDDLADDFEISSQEELSRDLYNEDRTDDHPTDKSLRRVRARMIWIRVDADGDGVAELLQILRVGRKILYKEEVSRIPVASGVACPLPHRHIGLSAADMVMDLQLQKTAVWRQVMDNLYLTNNPQKIVDTSKVNLDDTLVSIPGGVIRGEIDGIRYEEVPVVFPQGVQAIEFLSQVAQNRSGVNNGFTGVDSAQLSNIQPGTVNQLSSMAAERVVQIARVLAHGIEDLFSIVHEYVLKMGHKRESIQLGGKWVEIDPASWKRRDSFKIAVAFAAGNKDAQIARLSSIAQAQVNALQLGIPVVTPENYYQTLMELTKATDFTAASRFWTDPSQMPPKPQPPPPPELIKTQMDNQSAEKIKAAELAQREKESVRKSLLEQYAIDANAGLEIVHKSIDHGHTVAIEGLKASHAAILDGLSHKFDADTSATSKAVAKAHDSIQKQSMSLDQLHSTLGQVFEGVRKAGALATARKVVRRNDKGEVDGVDLLDHEGKVLASHKAMRDENGRVIGMQ
jgi:hypothetical protein